MVKAIKKKKIHKKVSQKDVPQYNLQAIKLVSDVITALPSANAIS
jgi:hypothetical protein